MLKYEKDSSKPPSLPVLLTKKREGGKERGKKKRKKREEGKKGRRGRKGLPLKV